MTDGLRSALKSTVPPVCGHEVADEKSADCVVLIVGDVFEPFDALAIELLLHSDVRNGCRR